MLLKQLFFWAFRVGFGNSYGFKAAAPSRRSKASGFGLAVLVETCSIVGINCSFWADCIGVLFQ
jgi:hypothetical protein